MVDMIIKTQFKLPRKVDKKDKYFLLSMSLNGMKSECGYIEKEFVMENALKKFEDLTGIKKEKVKILDVKEMSKKEYYKYKKSV